MNTLYGSVELGVSRLMWLFSLIIKDIAITTTKAIRNMMNHFVYLFFLNV